MSTHNTGIYEIKHIMSGRRYIGSAIDFCVRFRAHLNDLRQGKHPNRYLQFAWNKYGEDAFCVQPILFCCADDLLFYEQRTLDIFWGNSYNLTPTAGSQLGWIPSETTKQKISKTKSGQHINIPPRTSEHCLSISQALTGRKLASETRKRMSDTHKTRKRNPCSEETKRKISMSKKGNVPWNRNKTDVYSEETLSRISAASTGRVHSEETRQKMSDAHKTLRG